jgi:hypothetical protein
VTDSGGTDYIDNIAGTILYLYFAYKPNLKVLQDICDLSQAIQAANAGPHWIVTTDDKILLTTIGNHSAPSIAQGWPTYMNGSQALATLTYGIDFKEDSFETLNSAANYILYHGRFRKPANGDLWTENNSGLWAKTDCNLADESGAGLFKVGAYSLKVTQTATPSYISYPSGLNASWAISKLGGKYNIPTLGFWIYKNTGKVDPVTDYFRISLVTPAATYFYLDHLNPTEDAWTRYDLQLGDYANTGSNAVEWSKFGAATWTTIDYVNFTFVSAEATRIWYLDGLSINGWIKRGAKNSTLIGTDKLKLATINDDYAKDDSMIVTDDTGTIGRLAYAELLRRQTKPMVATLQTPMQRNALAGQLLHVHARPNSAGTWQINSDMRITQATQRIQLPNFRTVYSVTSDVINSMTRPAYDSLNQTLANYRPEAQDRQAANIKLRDIDITQAILEKDYP